MKRLAIFLIFWPLIGGLMVLAVLLVFFPAPQRWGEYFMMVYVVCSVPALLAALADWHFRELRFRALVTGLVSVVVAAFAIAAVYGPPTALLAIGAFLPGIVCSWLSERAGRPLLYFILLGPLLTWLIFVAMFLAWVYPGPVFEGGRWWAASLSGSYGLSLLPMLGAAWVDHRLHQSRWRVLACFAAGFTMAVAAFYSIADGGVHPALQKHWLFAGLLWGLPAGVCSWLSGRAA
jgi:hypothetical protein